MIRTLQRQISKAGQQVRQAFWGIIAQSGSRSAQLEGLNDEVLQQVEIIQQVGFASWVPEGTKVLLIPIAGKTQRAVVVGSTSAPVMIEVLEGETCIYDQYGHRLLLKEDGAHLNCDLYVEGNITSTGDVSDATSSMQDMRDIYNSHTNGNTPTPTPKM